jgi:transcriptional regulator of acetoin/glycerol metabolism
MHHGTENPEPPHDLLVDVVHECREIMNAWDWPAFKRVDRLRVLADSVELALIESLRDEGYTFTDIAAMRGVSRQAAYKRFRRLLDAQKRGTPLMQK